MSVKWEKPRPASHLSRGYAVSYSYNNNTVCHPAIEQGWTYFFQFSSRSQIQKCMLMGQHLLSLLHTSVRYIFPYW